MTQDADEANRRGRAPTAAMVLLVGAILSSALLVGCAAPSPAQESTATAKPSASPAVTPTETPAPDITASSASTAGRGDEPIAVVAAPDCSYGGKLKSIETVDDLTVKFTMCSPDAAFPAKAALPSLAIYPSEYLEATGGTGELLTNPIGTGPYRLESWTRDESIVLKRNEDYWGEKAKAETLVFRWDEDRVMRLLELQAGIVDGVDLPDTDDFSAIENDPMIEVYPRPALNTFYLGMNRDLPPFDNDLVRQALAIGLDRQRIVENFFPAGSEVASHFSPCALPGGCEGPGWYEFDPEKARELLQQAGFEDSSEIVITYRDVYRPYLPQPALVAQDIQDQLRDLGISASLRSMESGAFLDAVNAGQVALYLLGWSADFPDVTNFLDTHFGVGASYQFGSGYEDIWGLLDEAGATADQAKRNELYGEVNTLIQQYAPMAPVAHGGNAAAFRADVEGAHASPVMAERFSVMKPADRNQLTWIQSGEPISLYCADEEDGETLRVCGQINESLLANEVGGTQIVPALAERWESNADATEWTFHLREGVKFHDGSELDAGDVLLSYVLQWDAAHPLHTGREGSFNYWTYLFQEFLNVSLTTE